jgi:7-carboxy-7-deazaguanine synthase
MLKVLEHYVSVQGEGPRTGQLTQFVRFAGCNLRCPGWPCDTPQAIFPDRWAKTYLSYGSVGLSNRIKHVAEETGATNVCFTGGEPFLQPAMAMNDLLFRVGRLFGSFAVEVFTNGSFEIPKPWLDRAQINMDWKLRGSGEGDRDWSTRHENALKLNLTDMIKFVVKDTEDLNEAVEVTSQLKADGCVATFWVAAAFGHLEPAYLVDFIKEHKTPWALNVQVHKYIWDPERTLV